MIQGNQLIRNYECAICNFDLSYEEDKVNIGVHNTCIGKMPFYFKEEESK